MAKEKKKAREEFKRMMEEEERKKKGGGAVVEVADGGTSMAEGDEVDASFTDAVSSLARNHHKSLSFPRFSCGLPKSCAQHCQIENDGR